jgi:hypothetical protein
MTDNADWIAGYAEGRLLTTAHACVAELKKRARSVPQTQAEDAVARALVKVTAEWLMETGEKKDG